MWEAAKSVFASERDAGEDAIWRKVLIGRLADARVDMWCNADEDRGSAVDGAATPLDEHFDHPLHTMQPPSTGEQSIDYGVWDRLDEQRYVMMLANSAAAKAEQRSHRLKLLMLTGAVALVLSLGGITYITFAPTTTTLADPASPTPMALAAKAQSPIGSVRESVEPGSAPATRTAEPAPMDAYPHLSVDITASRNDAGELSVPMALSWPGRKSDLVVVVQGIPPPSSIVDGTLLPGGTWLVEPDKVSNLRIKNLPADQEKLSLRFGFTQNPDNTFCTVEMNVSVRAPASAQPAPSSESRPAPLAEKATEKPRAKPISKNEDDDEPVHAARERRSRNDEQEERNSDKYPNKSALGVRVAPAAAKPTPASDRPVAQLSKERPAWVRELNDLPSR